MRKIVASLMVLLFASSFAEALLVVGDTGDSSVYTDGTGAGIGWDYVGYLLDEGDPTPNPSSVSYVSNGWFVTARHVWNNEVINGSQETLMLGGNTYTINTGTYTGITSASGTAADLCMFRVTSLIGLPVGMSVMESTPLRTDALHLIGNGFDNGGQTGMTWGNGTTYVSQGKTFTLTVGTTESFLSVYNSGTAGSAYAQTYDSGGGVFVDGQLVGIMFSAGTYGGEDVTVVADFSVYGAQINEVSAIPEPASAILLVGVAALLGVGHRVRCMLE